MSKMVGIDLGTTNSLVAIVDSGIPYVIADSEGQRLTPSVVYYASPAEQPIVGRAANHVRVLHPSRTLYSIKRFMGRRANEVSEEVKGISYPVQSNPQGGITIPVDGKNLTPEEVSSEILKKLKADAERELGEEITKAVITVPAYFNDSQRNATKKAGELAGLTVERIINEPTAAALAYGLDKLQEKSKIAVYDFGGGTFDLSILELNGGVFQVLATHGNTRLGGDDLDKRLTEFLLDEISRQGGPARGEPSLLSKVREVAERAKIKLSTETETEITLPFLTSKFSFSIRLTREKLEELTRDLIASTRQYCLRALSDAKLTAKELDQVILVGGQTRMPLLRTMVSEMFECSEFEEERGSLRLGTEHHQRTGPQLNTSQNPDEAVALGAAIQAEILSGGFKNLLLLDVTPLSLGIETFGGLMNVIIPRNSTIPVKAGEQFTTAVDNQKNMLIHVLQGERERSRDNWSLGKFTIEFAAAPKGVPRVGVQFEIDANGILHVLARDIKTGKQTIVEMKSAVDVDDKEVQKMVEESVEHAFDDLKARQWIETKIKAGDNLTATRKAMAQYDKDLDPDYKAQLDAAIDAVEKILETENPKTKTGDPARLKEANANLDQVTKPLADHAMDQVMEEMLKRKGLISTPGKPD
ncbi:MAG: 2-alkenal reductase [Verrucomicrobiales bacterium]|nr:2-alkenal reductase [Verrucomicrobiales bacterium]